MFAEPVRTNERAIARNKLTILPCSINVLSSRTRAYVVTPRRLREREIGDSRVEIVTQSERKFFGFEPVDVLGQLLHLGIENGNAGIRIDDAAQIRTRLCL